MSWASAPFLLAAACWASSLWASPRDLLVYPAESFATQQPASAYDMVVNIPGFLIDAGDSDVRGLAGANGNVLIDSKWPTAKQDGVDSILKRIPSSAVARIELIRGGANGIDMRGRAVVANVIRKTDASLRGQAEAGAGRYGDGRATPSVKGNLSLRRGERVTETSVSAYRTIDDETGNGPRRRLSRLGRPLEKATYDERNGDGVTQFTLGHEQPALGGALQLNASLKRERGHARTYLAYSFPETSLEVVDELEIAKSAELGAEWNRRIASNLSLELTGLERLSRDRSRDHSSSEKEVEEALQSSHGGERIGRALLRWQSSPALTIEGGGETAYNFLDSHSALSIDGEVLPLPAANVRVAETRRELFASAAWQPSSAVSVNAALNIEKSRLAQTGDSHLVKPFTFIKPRLTAAWTSRPGTQWRLRLEREVGQLDFGDFVSSTSLTSDTITAGNSNLEPDRKWTLSLEWERRFWSDGAIVIAASHEWISHTMDRIRVYGPGYDFDAPGNVGPGFKNKIEATFTVPLTRLGLSGGMLRGNLAYQWTAVTDPTTGERRRISGKEPIKGDFHFTQDLPRSGLRWGIDMIVPEDEYEYRFNEIRRERIGTRWSIFAESRLGKGWTARAYVENLTGRRIMRDRYIFSGPRDLEPLKYSERRDLATSSLVGLLIRREFGQVD